MIKNMHSSSFWDSEILFGFTGNPSNFTQSLAGLIIIHCFSQHRNEGASNERNNKEARNAQEATDTKSMNKFKEKRKEISPIHTGEAHQFSLNLMVSMPYSAVF